MTDDPIHLDGRRSAAGQRQSEMRRRPANGEMTSGNPPKARLQGLEDSMLAEPAETWLDVMEKCRFLLARYALTPAAGNEQLQKLIESALGDMERLRNREERK